MPWKPKFTGGNLFNNQIEILQDYSDEINEKSVYSKFDISPYKNYYDRGLNQKYNNINFLKLK